MPRRNEYVPPDDARPFSVRRIHRHRQWAVDMDYLQRLRRTHPEAYDYMVRFSGEYYNSDNDLLRPEKHYARCAKCRKGQPCPRRPPEVPLHATDEQRRECYRLHFTAYCDVFSVGRVSLFEDVDSLAPNVPSRSGPKSEALRARFDAGDYEDPTGGATARPRVPVRPRTPARR